MIDITDRRREARARRALDRLGYVLRRRGDRYLVADQQTGGTVHQIHHSPSPYTETLDDVEDWVGMLQSA